MVTVTADGQIFPQYLDIPKFGTPIIEYLSNTCLRIVVNLA